MLLPGDEFELEAALEYEDWLDKLNGQKPLEAEEGYDDWCEEQINVNTMTQAEIVRLDVLPELWS